MESSPAQQVATAAVEWQDLQLQIVRLKNPHAPHETIAFSFQKAGVSSPLTPEIPEQALILLLQKAIRNGVLSVDFCTKLQDDFII